MDKVAYIRLGAFIGMLCLMLLGESLAPRRPLIAPRFVRWSGNLGILAIDNALIRVVFSILPIELAARAQGAGWGLLNVVALPFWLKALAGFILLDLTIYMQHVMLHAVPIFWRLHMMHHADVDFDFTTGVRFHPLEILLSLAIKLAAVAVVGPTPLSVLSFEIALNASSMFNHGNIRLPLSIDRILRLFIVTPDMHRVHHSVIPRETNSNFGFNFPWWDRLTGTYRGQPEAGHEGMTIGLKQFQEVKRQSLLWMLLLPFRATGQYPLNRKSTSG